MNKVIEVKWEDIDACCDSIASQIIASGKTYKGIVGIPRGGIIPAVILSHRLGVPLFVDQYCWDEEDFKNNLLVDDIWDSGKTMNEESSIRFTRVTLFVRYPENGTPDFWAREVGDTRWVQFPWEQRVD